MTVRVTRESARTGLYRKDVLTRLAERICEGELEGAADIEVSVLFCDDPRIRSLNKAYRGKDKATDVLSFPQGDSPVPGTCVLGDIVISLETVEGRNADDPAAMREDVRLLFCHGMLHLLGYDHGTAEERRVMVQKQAQYLGVPTDAAWRTDP
jgi:probable rRNA maturation factor